MKKLSMQAKFALGIILIGGAALAAEFVYVKYYPYYKARKDEKALQLLPYQNAALGIDMQVAACIYGKVDDFPGGVRIYRSHFFSHGPALIITSQPNPTNSDTFPPELLAKWETAGTYQNIPNYRFDHLKIQGRDAAMIWQSAPRARVLPAISFDAASSENPTLVTAHIISPDHIVEANCRPGSSDPALDVQACEESIKSIKVSGPPPKDAPEPGVIELKNVKPLH
ncbi:MAG TPA: hypothetical protein VFC10_11610 [Terriglobia bacterium]|jgi:hypothetical protein|nr:hypothetical protein [Terriglobia bacterium]